MTFWQEIITLTRLIPKEVWNLPHKFYIYLIYLLLDIFSTLLWLIWAITWRHKYLSYDHAFLSILVVFNIGSLSKSPFRVPLDHFSNRLSHLFNTQALKQRDLILLHCQTNWLVICTRQKVTHLDCADGEG